MLFVALAATLVQLTLISSAAALPSTSSFFATAAPRHSGQWSMFMNGPMRQGRTPIVGAQTSNLGWRIPAETNYGGPVIGRDGTIYQGTFAGQLLALNPDGTTKWAVSLPYIVESTPAILLDGRVAVVDGGGNLDVVNPDGSFSWRFRTLGVYNNAAPAIGRDGTIYTAGWATLYALHPDGSIRWTYDVGQHITGPPAVRPDGVVYVPAGSLFALDANGSLMWEWTPPSDAVGGAPAIGSNGTIFVNSFGHSLYAINVDGTLNWSYKAGDCCSVDVPSSPAIGRDGTIYAGETVLDDGMVLAFTPDGTLKWDAHQGRDPSALSIGGDGTIYFGAYTDGIAGPLYALNPDGTLKWEYDDPDGGYVRTPPAIGLGHRVYAGSVSGFFAIGP